MAQSGKTFIKKLLGSKLFLCLSIFILIGLVLNVGRESYRKYQLSKEIDKLELKISQLEEKNIELNNLIDYFSEESFLEKEAKVKLNLQKPGEKVIIFSNQEYKEENNININKLEEKQEKNVTNFTANFWKWWEYFFKRD